MGFMTEISVLNDRLSDIERDPARFVADIIRGTNHGGDRHFFCQTTIHPSHHADTAQVYLAARNIFIEAYPPRNADAQELSWRLDKLKEMRQYIAFCAKETKLRLEAERAKCA